MSLPVAAIFGAGPNVGKSVAIKFAQQGFRVAAITRSGRSAGFLEAESDREVKDRIHHYKADLSIPDSATDALRLISKELGAFPSFVFVNAASHTFAPADGPASLSVDSFRAALEGQVVSLFALAQASIDGFSQLPNGTPTSFIVTGNALNDKATFPRTPPKLLTLSVGKNSAGILIDVFAQAYGPKGYRFYYIDERTTEGGGVYDGVNGAAHASTCWRLFNQTQQGEWSVQFVKNQL